MRAARDIGIGTGIGLALLLGSAVVSLRGQGEVSAFKFHHVHLNTVDPAKAIDFPRPRHDRDQHGGEPRRGTVLVIPESLRLEAVGVKVLQRPLAAVDGLLRSAFIEAPDGVELELVDGHAKN
jgi:hypothetical protein